MSDERPMDIIHQRSIWGASWLSHVTVGQNYRPMEGATINEGMGIPNPHQEPTSPMAVRYLMLGRGGVYRNDETQRAYPVRHDADEITPRDPLALRVIPLSQDTGELPGYRLRKEVFRRGVAYAVYYAKVLPSAGPVVQSIVDLTHHNSISPLRPDPYKTQVRSSKVPAYRGLNDTELDIGRYGVISSSVEIWLTQQDEHWIREAAGILDEDAQHARVSEVFLCMGEERPVLNTDGLSVLRTEASYVQPFMMMSFASVDRLRMIADVGVSEPLVIEQSP